METAFTILGAISFCHLLNDMMQSLMPAIYPMLKTRLPARLRADRADHARPSSSPPRCCSRWSATTPTAGRCRIRSPSAWASRSSGCCCCRSPAAFRLLLVAAALVGSGSSVFHPESSRVARMASGGRHGLAQSLFQVGGNAGSAIGPLLAAFIVVPRGQRSIAWFSVVALLGIVCSGDVGGWYKRAPVPRPQARAQARLAHGACRAAQVRVAIAVLIALIFSKYFYLASLTSYYTFYLIHKFGVSVQNAQLHLFVFLGAVAAGTIIGGPVGDRIGRKYVIWCSILGVLPFTLVLPYANLFWTGSAERRRSA